MVGISKSLKVTVLILSSLAWLALPRLIDARPPLAVGSEQFDPSLSYIDSVDAADLALPRFIVRTGHPQKDVADAIQHMLSARFTHGFSEFRLSDNWIARAIGGGAVAIGLNPDSPLRAANVPVIQDEIFKHRRAMCTQQMLVFQALLARHGIDYARVSFLETPSHDAVAAKVDGIWRFYDSDYEPTMTGVPLRLVLEGSVLPRMYPQFKLGTNLGAHFQQLATKRRIVVRDIDRYPARRGALYQQVTGLLSRWGWLIPLFIAALAYRSRRLRSPSERLATADSLPA